MTTRKSPEAKLLCSTLVKLHKEYSKKLHTDREGSFAVLDEVDSMITDRIASEIEGEPFQTTLKAGKHVRIVVSHKNDGIRSVWLEEVAPRTTNWHRVLIGRSQHSALRWAAKHILDLPLVY